MEDHVSAWVRAGETSDDPRYHPADPLHWHPARRTRDVWINLDVLYPRPAHVSARRAVSGLDMTGVVAGLLTDWRQSGTGIWYGVCTFDLGDVDGRRNSYSAREQLVPASALRQPHDRD